MITVRLLPEQVTEADRILSDVLGRTPGKVGVDTLLFYPDIDLLPPEDMVVGVKLRVEYRQGTAGIYVRQRKKPGVKAATVNYVGSVISTYMGVTGRLYIDVRTSAADTVYILEPVDHLSEVPA